MANIPEFISVLRRIRDEIYPEVEAIYENTATLESQAEQSKIKAAASAAASALNATTATTRANEIKGITAQANTLIAGSLATVSYNSTDGKFTFGLPVGAKGDKGESYTINATGTTAGRAAYDTQSVGFSYLDISLSIVYFKLSSTSGDWSTGTSFGRGEDGANGADGTGITSIAFYSTTSDNGLASQQGGVDTYRITLSNSNTYDISVVNGRDLNINGCGDKTTIVDEDEFAIADSDSYYNIKKLSFANLKATLLTYFDTIYSRTSKIFGIEQYIQDFTQSRLKGVIYTNNTGKPIYVSIYINTNILQQCTLYVNGIISGATGIAGWSTISGIVPNGATYFIGAPDMSQLIIGSWSEFR